MKGQRAHPGAEAIAACMGGVRTWRARRVAAHIGACPSCSALGRQLGQVSTVLAAVSPPPLPGDVARRLDAALASEVALRAMSGSALPDAGVPAAVPSESAEVPPEPVAVPPGPAAPDGQRRRRLPSPPRTWRVARPAPVLAALTLCLVLAGGGYLISQSGGTSSTPTASSAGQSAAGPHHVNSAARPAIISGPTATFGATSFKVISTNTDYLPATLRAQALSQLRLPRPSAGSHPSGTLQACVIEVAGSDRDNVDFVDLASYQGRPAIIIVARDHAWVTGRGCNATQHEVIDSVRLSGG